MRDVEIRGVGNILGTKQHGHMINVGFDTYCQLLEETVNELKGEQIKANKPTIVDINITAFIPDEWVGSTEQKMIEYKRLSECGVTIIREAGNDIRVYSPFTPYEWNIIKNGLDKNILRRVKFTVAPKTCQDGKSILLINYQNLTFEEIFNILTGLFYYIKETISKYK